MNFVVICLFVGVIGVIHVPESNAQDAQTTPESLNTKEYKNIFGIISAKKTNTSTNATDTFTNHPCTAVFIDKKWLLTSLRCFSDGEKWTSKKIKYFYIHPDYENNYKKSIKKVFKIPFIDHSNHGYELALVALNGDVSANVTVLELNNQTHNPQEVEIYSFKKTDGRKFDVEPIKLWLKNQTNDDNDDVTVTTAVYEEVTVPETVTPVQEDPDIVPTLLRVLDSFESDVIGSPVLFKDQLGSVSLFGMVVQSVGEDGRKLVILDGLVASIKTVMDGENL